jgi:glycine betaine/choline ABC-type transport system substrate-binding protein
VASSEIDVTAGDATSGLIGALDLMVLADDRQYFPVYDAVPVARSAMLLKYPGVAGALRRLEGRISAAEMQRMNFAVDGDKRAPAEVARAFLDTIESFYVQPR